MNEEDVKSSSAAAIIPAHSLGISHLVSSATELDFIWRTSDVLPNLICREFGFFEVKFGSINVVKLRINSANAVRCLVLCNLSMLIKYYDTFMGLVPFQICFFFHSNPSFDKNQIKFPLRSDFGLFSKWNISGLRCF